MSAPKALIRKEKGTITGEEYSSIEVVLDAGLLKSQYRRHCERVGTYKIVFRMPAADWVWLDNPGAIVRNLVDQLNRGREKP